MWIWCAFNTHNSHTRNLLNKGKHLQHFRMLEDDCKRPQPTVHLSHQEPWKNPTNILAQDHLQPTPFRPLQPRQHEHHHHAKAMEMDRACDEKRARQHLPHSPSLDTRGEADTGATQEHLASNSGFVPFFGNKFPGLFQDFSRTQIDFSRALKFTLTVHSQDLNVNSPHCLPYTS